MSTEPREHRLQQILLLGLLGLHGGLLPLVEGGDLRRVEALLLRRRRGLLKVLGEGAVLLDVLLGDGTIDFELKREGRRVEVPTIDIQCGRTQMQWWCASTYSAHNAVKSRFSEQPQREYVLFIILRYRTHGKWRWPSSKDSESEPLSISRRNKKVVARKCMVTRKEMRKHQEKK